METLTREEAMRLQIASAISRVQKSSSRNPWFVICFVLFRWRGPIRNLGESLTQLDCEREEDSGTMDVTDLRDVGANKVGISEGKKANGTLKGSQE